jgi:hypothetical protein
VSPLQAAIADLAVFEYALQDAKGPFDFALTRDFARFLRRCSRFTLSSVWCGDWSCPRASGAASRDTEANRKQREEFVAHTRTISPERLTYSTPQTKTCLRGKYGRSLLKRRGELLERSFAHCYETGGTRRCTSRGRANILKRLLIHVGAFTNISLAS